MEKGSSKLPRPSLVGGVATLTGSASRGDCSAQPHKSQRESGLTIDTGAANGAPGAATPPGMHPSQQRQSNQRRAATKQPLELAEHKLEAPGKGGCPADAKQTGSKCRTETKQKSRAQAQTSEKCLAAEVKTGVSTR